MTTFVVQNRKNVDYEDIKIKKRGRNRGEGFRANQKWRSLQSHRSYSNYYLVIICQPYRITVKRNNMKEFNCEVIYEVPGLKVSNKMRKAIEKLEKKYGQLNKRFFIEMDERVRVGRGYCDGCQLTDDIIKSRNIVVAHDGTIYE